VASLAVKKEDILVIGADSLIGASLMDTFKSRGVSVVGTSRRKSDSLLFLDLASPIDLSALPKASTVFLCAGINGFEACNQDPVIAAQVNVVATLAIGVHYMKQGGHVVFLSSSAVFGTRSDIPDEQDNVSPNTIYGVFKCATEIALLEASKNSTGVCSIVRLTKVFSATSLLLKKWRDQGMESQGIEAFFDITLSPISLNYVVNSLVEVGDRKLAGCVHLAGEQTITYADLAYALCEKWFIPKAMVKRISQSATAKTAPLPQCSVLAMHRTKSELGIKPQLLAEFLVSIESETEFVIR
jgi:dTDP-4-dehydrorhamnose reductase